MQILKACKNNENSNCLIKNIFQKDFSGGAGSLAQL
jgi:hypothetical protein